MSFDQDVDHEFGQLDESQSSQGGGTMLSASEKDSWGCRGGAAAAPGGELQHCAAGCTDYKYRYIEPLWVKRLEFFVSNYMDFEVRKLRIMKAQMNGISDIEVFKYRFKCSDL